MHALSGNLSIEVQAYFREKPEKSSLYISYVEDFVLRFWNKSSWHVMPLQKLMIFRGHAIELTIA